MARAPCRFIARRKTIKKHMAPKLKTLKVELRKRMHDSIAATRERLSELLKGHLNYFVAPDNGRSLCRFFREARWRWLRSLRLRRQKTGLTWETLTRLAGRFFPPIKILHPQARRRFDARPQGRSQTR
jgi:RNA-directed DNA polymerase